MRTLHIDFREFGHPLAAQIMAWVKEEKVSLPLLLIQSGVSLSAEESHALAVHRHNAISAVQAPYHPYLLAARDRDSGEISFPFRKHVGEGKRRQDLDPVFLAVPRFALVHDMNSPLKPFSDHVPETADEAVS